MPFVPQKRCSPVYNEPVNYLSGSQILAEETSGNITVYVYDAEGTPIGMRYHGADYSVNQWDVFWYEKNLQGDVVAVYSEAGTKLISYTYDAFGQTMSMQYNGGYSTAAYNNPFRYRGYYYDKDLGLYYVSSRYYDPVISRWINADTTDVLTVTTMGLTDKNLFAYCDNNPVMRADSGGDFWHIIAGAVAGALIAGVTKIISNVIDEKSLTDELATEMISGAASGALASTGVGIVGMVAGNMAISMAENAANQVVDNGGVDDFDVGDMLIDGAIAGVSSALGDPGKGTKHLTNLGKQTVKRTYNATTQKGMKAGFKEAGKAFTYYKKNSTRYYRQFKKDFFHDMILAPVKALVSSEYMQNQYISLLGR